MESEGLHHRRQNSYALISSPGFRPVERSVRKFDDFFGANRFVCAATPWEGSPSHRASLSHSNAVSQIKGFRRHDLQNRSQNAGVPDGSAERDMIRNSSPPQRTSTSDLRTTLAQTFRHSLQQAIACGMTMQIVHFLEEVHVHHDEDQIAMIQLTNVAASRPLVISQDLPGFRRKNFFEIAPVPHASQTDR